MMLATTLSAFLSSTDLMSFEGSFKSAERPLPNTGFFTAFVISY